MQATQRLPYLWDYDLDRVQFREILEGRRTLGRLDQDWAARRLLEYAPYEEIIHLLGYKNLWKTGPAGVDVSARRAACVDSTSW